METTEKVLQGLIELSRRLGDESKEFVILGEGNTSAKISDSEFFVKASGCRLGSLASDQVVRVNSALAMKMLDDPELSNIEMRERLKYAMTDKTAKLLPSVETLFHAYLLTLPNVNFVAHTHPVSLNSILCAQGWKDAAKGRLFPDEIICCGASSVYLEYADPGVPLARAMRAEVEQYIRIHGVRPKAILMQNHGLVALGSTAKEVESITAMWDKTAKILMGTFHFGGPNFLTDAAVDRIAGRPDEDQRRRLIEGRE